MCDGMLKRCNHLDSYNEDRIILKLSNVYAYNYQHCFIVRISSSIGRYIKLSLQWRYVNCIWTTNNYHKLLNSGNCWNQRAVQLLTPTHHNQAFVVVGHAQRRVPSGVILAHHHYYTIMIMLRFVAANVSCCRQDGHQKASWLETHTHALYCWPPLSCTHTHTSAHMRSRIRYPFV